MEDRTHGLSIGDVESIPGVGEATGIGSSQPANQNTVCGVYGDYSASWKPDKRYRAVVIADGDEACTSGEVASRVAAETAIHIVRTHTPVSDPDLVLYKALAAADASLKQRAKDNSPTSENLRSAIVTGLFLESHGWMYTMNVGSSHAYFVPDGEVSCIQMSDHGTEGVGDSNYLGTDERYASGSSSRNHRAGDMVLCTQGIVNAVTDWEIGSIVAACETPQEAASGLIDRAVTNGCSEDASVVVVDVTGQTD